MTRLRYPAQGSPDVAGANFRKADFAPQGASRLKIINPDQIAGLKLWIEADEETGFSDGDAVATATDHSGVTGDLTQGDADKRPTFETDETNAIRHLPVFKFDGQDDYLGQVVNDWQGSDTEGTFAFILRDDTGATGTLFGTSDSTVGTDEAEGVHLRLSILGAGSVEIDLEDTGTGLAHTIRSDDTVSSDIPTIIIISSDGSSYDIRINGVSSDLSVIAGADDGKWISSLTSATLDGIQLGVRLEDTLENLRLNGELAMAVYYNRGLPLIEKRQLELNYADAKYGIDVTP